MRLLTINHPLDVNEYFTTLCAACVTEIIDYLGCWRWKRMRAVLNNNYDSKKLK